MKYWIWSKEEWQWQRTQVPIEKIKPVPVLLFLPQIPHILTWCWMQASVVRSQWLSHGMTQGQWIGSIPELLQDVTWQTGKNTKDSSGGKFGLPILVHTQDNTHCHKPLIHLSRQIIRNESVHVIHELIIQMDKQEFTVIGHFQSNLHS